MNSLKSKTLLLNSFRLWLLLAQAQVRLILVGPFPLRLNLNILQGFDTVFSAVCKISRDNK